MTTIQEFNQIDGRISSLYHAAALKMGLSDSEFRILYTLAVNAPGYLQSALREATGMGRSTVNSALKKLEREGILTLSPGSGRHTCVSLTAQGHRLADRTVPPDPSGGPYLRQLDAGGAGSAAATEPGLHRKAGGHRGVFVMGHPPRSKKGHGRHSLSCPFLCLLTARSRRPWGCRQPETRRCRCAWW